MIAIDTLSVGADSQGTCAIHDDPPGLQPSQVHADSASVCWSLARNRRSAYSRMSRLRYSTDVVSGRRPQSRPCQFRGDPRVVQAPEVGYAYGLESVVPVVSVNEDDCPIGHFDDAGHGSTKKSPGVWLEPDPGGIKASVP